jgi:hypothetical protein
MNEFELVEGDEVLAARQRLGTLGTASGSALVLCGTVYRCNGGSALQGGERQQCYPNGTCNAGSDATACANKAPATRQTSGSVVRT